MHEEWYNRRVWLCRTSIVHDESLLGVEEHVVVPQTEKLGHSALAWEHPVWSPWRWSAPING